MKTIIAGSRTINEAFLVYMAIADSKFHITEVVSGGCGGVDTLGEEWARSHDIPVMRIPADWASYGKAAGPIRNSRMATYADALIAIWDGKSRGTEDMIRKAEYCKMKVYVKKIGLAGPRENEIAFIEIRRTVGEKVFAARCSLDLKQLAPRVAGEPDAIQSAISSIRADLDALEVKEFEAKELVSQLPKNQAKATDPINDTRNQDWD